MVGVTADSVVNANELDPGTRVEVRRRFDRAWARGFEVIDVSEAGYRLRRTSDNAVLPVPFPRVDVRAAVPRSTR
jgi:hypothetical protein